MALVDLGMYVFVEATMGHIVRKAARYGVTGQTDASTTGDWADAVLQTAIGNNPYGTYIEVTPTTSSSANGLLIQSEDGAQTWPATFPRGTKMRFRLTQEFKYFTPFLKLLEGPNGQITIRVETVYQTEE